VRTWFLEKARRRALRELRHYDPKPEVRAGWFAKREPPLNRTRALVQVNFYPRERSR
jgi:hypothetical protein